MKTIRKTIGVGIAITLLFALNSFAIEGLKVSVQSSNAVLSWPSTYGENYIIQHRPTMNATSVWETLTSVWPSDSVSNFTFFVHSNSVQYPPPGGGGTNGGGFPMPPDNGTNSSSGGTNGFQSRLGFYQVVKDGVKIPDSVLTNLTAGVLTSNVTITFEAGNAANDGTGTNVLGEVVSASILIDGAKFAGEGVLSFPTNFTRWQFSMDTAYLENGDHSLQLAVTWFDPNNTDPNNIFPTKYSDPITISVSNVIFYPQWEEDVGEAGISAYFLKTVAPSAAYQIDISDVNGGHVKTLTGTATNGEIEAFWNMVDTNGVLRTNPTTDPEFSATVSLTDAAPQYPASKKTPPKKQPVMDWPEHGKWTVSFLDYFRHEYSQDNRMQFSINDVAYTAQKFGGYWLWYPQPGDTNDIGQTYPLRYNDTNHPTELVTYSQITKDNALLKLFLSNTNSRNYFYKGHGAPNAIGYLSSSAISDAVKHRYRFVMLLGCNTANGNLDKAFKINGPGQFELSHYQRTGNRPAAFCGYSTVTHRSFNPIGGYLINGVQYDGMIPWQVPGFLDNFLFYWDSDLGNEPLNNAINDARDDLPPVTGFPIQPGQNLQIYGYPHLRVDEFNYKSNWP